MRIELSEKIADISEEEKYRWEEMNIPPKDKRFKWRKVWFTVEDIFAVKEVSDRESIIEFTDTVQIVVKGSYDEIKSKIEKIEAEIPEETETD